MCNRLYKFHNFADNFKSSAQLPMKKPNITIHDIAKELNISASTVSRALNNNPRISPGTKHAVRELARKYNYQPNVMASSLRRGQGNTVGVIIPRINRSFFSNVIGGMEEILSAAGYNLMICQSHELYENEVKSIQAMINARVNAVIMSVSMETKKGNHIQQLKERNIKLYFFDRVCDQITSSAVTIDDEAGGYLATSHLIDQGYKRIVHIAGADHINIYKARKLGYVRAMNKAGITIKDRWIMEYPLVIEGGQAAFKSFMKWKEKPDAVFCAGDYAALGIILAAKKARIAIPHDLGVVGFANEPFTEFLEPGLTSVDQKGEKMGRLVAEQFLKETSNSDTHTPYEAQVLQPELLIRTSSLR